jgi:hypothetical protein
MTARVYPLQNEQHNSSVSSGGAVAAVGVDPAAVAELSPSFRERVLSGRWQMRCSPLGARNSLHATFNFGATLAMVEDCRASGYSGNTMQSHASLWSVMLALDTLPEHQARRSSRALSAGSAFGNRLTLRTSEMPQSIDRGSSCLEPSAVARGEDGADGM